MKNLIILTIVAIVLVGVIVFIYSGDTVEAPTLTPTSTISPQVTPTPTVEETPVSSPVISNTTVLYSNSGYSPATITVKKGDTVFFDNKSSKIMWTASAVHPTHKVYPGTDITFCGTPQSTGAFDACKGYGPGESWEFNFNKQGTWKYHNHLQANHTGTIVVE